MFDASVQEILEWLSERIPSESRYYDGVEWYELQGEFSGLVYNRETRKMEVVPEKTFLNGYKFDFIQWVGGEGQGDYARLLFSLSDDVGNVRYFSKEGSYSSYDGFEWDGRFKEVRPVEKTVTFYE